MLGRAPELWRIWCTETGFYCVALQISSNICGGMAEWCIFRMFLQLKLGLNDLNVPGSRLTWARNMISGNRQFLDPRDDQACGCSQGLQLIYLTN